MNETEKKALSQTHPDIAQEWHPTKNEGLTPNQVTAGSGRVVWWRCCRNSEHEWRKAIFRRTAPSTKRGCPFCVGQRITESHSNSLAVLFPAVAAQWDYAQNGDLLPENVTPGANRRVWWRCPKGPDHVWQTYIRMRTRVNSPVGCPCCAGKKLSVTNSLATRFPQVAQEWHYGLNGSLTPDQVIAGTHLKVWWQCAIKAEHVWSANINNRTKATQPSHCPYCSGQQRLEK